MRGQLVAVVVLILVATIGCQMEQGTSLVSTSKNSTADGEWLAVTREDAALADARRRADRVNSEEYEGIFAHLSDPYAFVGFDTIEKLSRHDDAIPRLKREIPEGVLTQRGVGAALLLCQLHEVESRNYLVDVLERGDVEQRLRVLHGIDSWRYGEDSKRVHCQFIADNQQLVGSLLRQLDDENPDLVKAAIQACGSLNLPGVHGKFHAMLKTPKVVDADRIMFWLSKGPLTAEVLDTALRASKANVENDSHWGVALFEAFVRQDRPELRKRARDELKRQLAEWPDDGRRGFRSDRIGILEALAETSDPNDVPWLKETLANERGYYAAPLLVALVRLEGNEGRSRLLSLLRDDEQRSTAIQAAGEAFANSGDEDVVKELAQTAGNSDGREVQRICSALKSIGGDAARRELEKLIGRLDPANREWFQQGLDERHSLDEIKSRVVEAGLIDEGRVVTAIERINDVAEDEQRSTPGLIELLAAADVMVLFDAETGMLPCRHDKLVASFAAASRGGFAPTAISEEWHRKDDDDFDADYTLRFILGDMLYSGQLRNFGDWYDVERTVTMINRALGDAGKSERFVPIATGGQMASFVFSDPEIFAQLAEEFHVPLGEDLSEAMIHGQEYERQVLEQLDQSGR